ncbi:MAG: hypothetical protein HY093_04570 [Candidatus Liptonbacteria bacterium]|nr:hypothetical protein [Candidatus Liptonbacteria bacterium]
MGQIVKVLEAEKEQEIREKMAENPEDFAPATEPSLDEGKKTPPPPVRDVNGPESSRDFRPPISVPHESPTPPPPAQNQEGATLGSQKEKNASREDLTTKVSALEKEVLSQSGMPEVEFESIKSRSVKYFLSRYGGTMGLLEFGLGRPGEGTTVEERAHRVNFANWLERALGKPGVNRQMADQMSLEEFFRYVASLNQNPK